MLEPLSRPSGLITANFPGFATKTARMSDPTKKGLPEQIKWTAELQVDFDQLLIQDLVNKPVLSCPD